VTNRIARSGLPRARKRFGQHFLEPAWVTKLVDALDAQPADRFIEIGPGRGALTLPLATRVADLVAVELDRDLAAHLSATTGPPIRVVTADFLDVDVRSLVTSPAAGPVRVVGNLPYNVSAPILFKLFAASAGGQLLSDATVMLQKEVADRLVAAPNTSEYGVLSVYAALYADVTRLLTLPPGAFRPPPKVTSAVVRLRFRPPQVDIGQAPVFDDLVRGSFAHRRKKLLNALHFVADRLSQDPAALIGRAGLDPGRRPGELTLTDFAALARAVL
jgi:16S rRNA (adenine1518-N6/adenine1519-N6)-dimethyltransferase